MQLARLQACGSAARECPAPPRALGSKASSAPPCQVPLPRRCNPRTGMGRVPCRGFQREVLAGQA